MCSSVPQYPQIFSSASLWPILYHRAISRTSCLCPACRYQQRLLHRNEWNLYRRKCNGTGKSILSIYSEDKPFTVYEPKYWWGDDWDVRDYGRTFDFSRPFFEQFAELQAVVPRLAIVNTHSENSEYTHLSTQNKDCYLLACCSYNERCQYGFWTQNSLDCLDCYTVEKSERCYQCMNGKNLYHCAYVNDSENCNHCWFSSDCVGCSNIFGSRGLRNKSYFLFDRQVTKEEWEQYLGALRLTPRVINDLFERLEREGMRIPRKYYRGMSNEDFSGDFLQNCKNTYHAFNCRDCWDVWTSQDAWRAKDSLDITEILDVERCYQVEGFIGCDSAFCTKGWSINNCLYSDICFHAHDLFGCVGMHSAGYCVFNKEYSKSEYEDLVVRIIYHMQATGEWGTYFPSHLTHFGYNETTAAEYYPLRREEVLARGWNWFDDPEDAMDGPHADYTPPEAIETVADDIIEKILICEVSGKLYRINKQELEFYRTMGLPLPLRCPKQRRAERMNRRNPRQLWKRRCMNHSAKHSNCDPEGRCTNEIETSYAPDRPELVYCEACYLAEVY
ncbi:hypothetical protein OAO01_04945 [Oligoflexia bacterium]|nr:hypothetical protein [Oligoflexia bacterium]